MAYLLDTSVILWAMKYPERLGPKTTEILKNERHYISVASIWEITIKVGTGKLRVPLPASEVITILKSEELLILPRHVDQITDIKLPHNDPFDFLLVAQAKIEGLTLLTTDKIILNSPYQTFLASL